ncbi:DEAD/DEAH box helicase family protein [Kitasatospora sp. NPDC028055]|uniref:DEAD/DEAH box helicase family protein n=1 Tax=Kitasatospora sp. NPDC028055 TaxID=3155653 RepID=UPI0033E77DEA
MPHPLPAQPAGLQVTVQMATGSGKSYVGAAAAQKLAPRGTVLVVVPTLDLLVQMVASWQQAGRSGRIHAVCSLTPGALPRGVRGSEPAADRPVAPGRRPQAAAGGVVRDLRLGGCGRGRIPGVRALLLTPGGRRPGRCWPATTAETVPAPWSTSPWRRSGDSWQTAGPTARVRRSTRFALMP